MHLTSQLAEMGISFGCRHESKASANRPGDALAASSLGSSEKAGGYLDGDPAHFFHEMF
jgi:hypothetical protein